MRPDARLGPGRYLAMHRRNITHILVRAAALTLTAAVLSLVIVFGRLNLTSVGTFAALLVLGWLIAAAVGRWVGRDKEEEAPWTSVPLQSAVAEPSVPVVSTAAPSEPSLPDTSPATSSEALDTIHKDAAPSPLGAALGDGVVTPAEPTAIEPSAVLASVVEGVSTIVRVASAGLWLEDPSTASLRLVVGGGAIPPGDTPIDLSSALPESVLADGVPAWFEQSDIVDSDGTRRVWRFVQPIDTGEARGAVILDAVPLGAVSLASLAAATRPYRGALTAALALHVARQQTVVAGELIEAARDLSRLIDPDAVLSHVLDRAVALAAAESGSVMLVADDGMLRIRESRGLPVEVVNETRVTPGEGIAGWVFASEKPLLVEDLPTRRGETRRRNVRSAVSVPIADEDGVIGVLNVGSRAFPARFTRAHMDAMEVLGRQACVAYRNACALGATRDLYLSTVKTLAIAMESKDPYARGCTRRVVDLVVALGEALELDDETMTSLEVASLFHDVGMASVGIGSGSVERPLTTIERGLVKMHPAIAADLLREAPALQGVAPIVYHHHERYDGGGYAGGIGGDDIPMGARILAVVDAFVAMTSDRPYRAAIDTPTALAELQEHSGTQFDPIVVDCLVELLGGIEDRVRRDAE